MQNLLHLLYDSFYFIFQWLGVYLVYFYEALYNSAHHSELLNLDQIKLSSPGLL